MRIHLLCLALFCSFGFACSAPTTYSEIEHAADAGMQSCASLTVYTVDSSNGVTAVQKQLPWQSDMAAYALSFALPNTDTRYDVAITDGQATVNICPFPAYTTEEAEDAAVAAIVNTMLSYPGVDSVILRFDGRVIDTLPHGTKVNGNFITFCNTKKHPLHRLFLCDMLFCFYEHKADYCI